jgi:hypothetical protein
MSMKLGILTYKTPIGGINNWMITRILGPMRQKNRKVDRTVQSEGP